MTTQKDLLEGALAEIGVIDPTESAGYKELMAALSHVNLMLDTWATRRLFAYYIECNSFAWTASQQSYDIGPSGADFTLARPVKIHRANLIRVSADPDQHVPLFLYEINEYSDIPYPAESAEEPQLIYYQPTYPNGTIWPWPYPDTSAAALANKLELFTWHQLTAFAESTLTTDLSLPPGYAAAIQHSLAENLCVPFGKPLTGDLERLARRSRAAIISLNTKAPKISTQDSGMPQSPSWA